MKTVLLDLKLNNIIESINQVEGSDYGNHAGKEIENPVDEELVLLCGNRLADFPINEKNRINYHKKLQELLDAGADVDIKENDENIKN